MSKKIIFEDKYIIGCGLGSWAKSYERGVKKGDVRYIKGMLMYAEYVYGKPFFKKEINWVPVDKKLDWDKMKSWINSL